MYDITNPTCVLQARIFFIAIYRGTVHHFLCKFKSTRLAMKAKAKRLKKAAPTDMAFFK
jgi:hypothetical protein